jgi:hypothetical protein
LVSPVDTKCIQAAEIHPQVGGPIYVEVGEAWRPGREVAGKPQARDIKRLTDKLMEQIGGLARRAEARAGF